MGNASIGDQNVQAAKMAADLLHCGVHRSFFGDIRLHRKHRTAKPGRRPFRSRQISI